MISCRPRFNLRGLFIAAALSTGLLGPALADEEHSTTTPEGVTVKILSLKHTEGDTVTLRWEVVNGGRSDFSMTDSNEQLIDIVGRRLYQSGIAGGRCSADAGKSTQCWAMFAAPPSSAKTMAVKFYEKIDMISGVPVTD